nr:VP1 [Letea virus]
MREQRRKLGTKYEKDDETLEEEARLGLSSLYGYPILFETDWKDILNVSIDSKDGVQALNVYINSLQDVKNVDPEEEFLRNYRITKQESGDVDSIQKFILMRSKNEMQVYGDMALKHWAAFVEEVSLAVKHEPLGLQVIRSFVSKYGFPFQQNTRDLSQINELQISCTTPLLVEMCIAESLIEYNMVFRLQELQFKNLEFNDKEISPFSLIREFFIICLPHPKKINNILRAAYTWFVKMWGTMRDEVVVLQSFGGDDRNAKDVYYTDFRTLKNPYADMMKRTQFYKESQDANILSVDEAVRYSQQLSGHKYDLKIFRDMLQKCFLAEFSPLNMRHVVLASLLLSIQTITGYGRAWTVNMGSDTSKQMKPQPTNYIQRASEYTRNNFIKAYQEAKAHGFDLVKPEDMYTSMLRLARNTSSGFSAQIEIEKAYGPQQQRKKNVVINSRIKALVIFSKGQDIYKREELIKKYNTVKLYQTKGSRDVPIKSTRTIFAINLSILAPQLILTLPLNEYFAKIGGSTTPSTSSFGGKIIIGDLEATGSRVMDAADTFRNSSDPEIFIIAIDYKEYDTHMTWYNFRSGMIEGLENVVSEYKDRLYDGYTLSELIEFGYGEGRVQNTLWNGKRRVYKVRLSDYDQLLDSEKQMGDFKPPIGCYPVSDIRICEKLMEKIGKNEESLSSVSLADDYILVSPTDGSDLANINTHLSGENSTLIANSLHNAAIGRIMQEELKKRNGGKIEILSEQYVGDDTLFYAKLHTRSSTELDSIISTIMDAISKAGHEVSASKTIFAPFSAEKTQTHAKQGIYIPQDRIMVISSERKKDIEDVQGYMKSQIMTMITKVSRGFSMELAYWILHFKSMFIGYRKLKRTIRDKIAYRDRLYDSNEEDGYTLCRIRDPLVLYTPIDWNGYGAHPTTLNIVMTPDIYIDSNFEGKISCDMDIINTLISDHPPHWNETKADKRQIRSETKMGFFSKMARPTVYNVLQNEKVLSEVSKLPLGDYMPHRISHTMMHSALMKEQRARALLAPGYELEYQQELNKWIPHQYLKSNTKDMEISSSYIKIFNVDIKCDKNIKKSFNFPDLNISPNFFIQKRIIGNRESVRIRMSYIDKLDSILRGDIVMRGFLTATTLMNILEKIGTCYSPEDLSTIFKLMNIEERVADRLAQYVTAERARFDALQLVKSGIGGDEFSMSLNVATQDTIDKFVIIPAEFSKTENDAVALYTSQLMMLKATLGIPCKHILISVSADEKVRLKQRRARFRTHLPKLKLINKVMGSDRLSARLVENQFV